MFAQAFPARGLAVGDFDNDGAVDVLRGQQRRRPSSSATAPPREPLGRPAPRGQGRKPRTRWARVVTWSAGGVQRRGEAGGGSYLSSHDPRVVLGLGAAPARLAGGTVAATERAAWSASPTLPINRYITITEGSDAWQ